MRKYTVPAERWLDPVSYSFEIGGEEWKLEVMPKSGWVNSQYFIVVIAGGAFDCTSSNGT